MKLIQKTTSILFIFILCAKIGYSKNTNPGNPSPSQVALTGSYVIGAAPSDYTTFTLAVTALTTNGVSGPVIFNVKTGVYSEHISIPPITGASAINTITFQSQTLDSTNVTLSYQTQATAASNYAIQLAGADYITFKNMTIQRILNGGNTSYGIVIDVSGGSTHNTFSNNYIKGITATAAATPVSIIYSTNAADDSYNSFSNNLIENGSNGIYYLGQNGTYDAGTIIRKNSFLNQYSQAIYTGYQNAPVISENIINTNSIATNFYGIYCSYCSNALRVERNKIVLSNGGTGLYLNYCAGAPGQYGLTSNNFITVLGNVVSNGISENLSTNQNLYYNSINITNTSATSKGLYMNGVTSSNFDIKNNIFSNTGGGFAIFIESSATAAYFQANNNDIYTNGSNYCSWGATGNVANIAAWRTASGKDNLSISADPLFLSVTDLHTNNNLLYGMGIPLTSVSTPVIIDIDGQSRSVTTPCIGADEFTINDLGVSKIILPSVRCEGMSFHVGVYVKNFKNYSFTGSIPVSYTFGMNPVVNAVIPSTTINANDSLLYTFTNNETGIVGTYTVGATTSISGDMNVNNDNTVFLPFTVNPNPTANAGADQAVCLGNSVTFTSTPFPIYIWSNGMSSQSFSFTPTDTTTMILTVTDSNGCSDIDSVTAFTVSFPVPIAGFTNSISDLTVTFTNTSTNGTNYSWAFGDGQTDTLENPIHTYTNSNTYTVTLITSNMCGADTSEVLLTVVGIEEFNDFDRIVISPNPFSNNILIDFSKSLNKPKKLILYNILNQEILNIVVNEFEISKNIDLSNLPNGIYNIKAVFNNRVALRKLIKQ
ncbi:MAG: T9SS type A sorting domain-containing protein [Bacteroidetes bacterium]|nr:T9SS type A sorting domain-containing protein [Bacteroidota bacterium]